MAAALSLVNTPRAAPVPVPHPLGRAGVPGVTLRVEQWLGHLGSEQGGLRHYISPGIPVNSRFPGLVLFWILTQSVGQSSASTSL